MKKNAGLSACCPSYLNLQPVHSIADASAQGLGGGLLGGKASGKTLCCLALAQAVGLLCRGVDAIQKSAPIAIHGVLDAPNVNQIYA